MQLRGLRDAIRHARTANTASRNRAGNQHHTAFRISIESRNCSCGERFHAEHVRFPAAVPFLVRESVEVVEVREARPACVGDDDVEPAESLRGGLHERGDGGSGAGVGFDGGCFHAVGGFEFGGEVLRGGGVVGVVDGDIGALCGEGTGDVGAEASVGGEGRVRFIGFRFGGGNGFLLWLWLLILCGCCFFSGTIDL